MNTLVLQHSDVDLVLDLENKSDHILVSWSSYYMKNYISIPKLIEEKWGYYREKLFDLLDHIIEINIFDKNLYDFFKIYKNFSFLEMTLLLEKSSYKTSFFFDYIRLMCLADIVKNNNISHIELLTEDKACSKLIKKFCKTYNIGFYSHKQSKNVVFNFKKKFPEVIKAFFYYYSYVKKNTKNIFKNACLNNNSYVSFVSYFPNIDYELAKNGVFYSNYWRDLTGVLRNENVKVNWFFLFENSEKCSKKNAVEFIKKFNANYKNQNFYFIEEFISINILCKVIYRYFQLIMKSYLSTAYIKKYFQKNNISELFFIFKQRFLKETVGAEAINNLFKFFLIEKIGGQSNSQSKCFYLMENQPWEKALAYTWKENCLGTIYGFIHAGLRNFDMRYYLTNFQKSRERELSQNLKICVYSNRDQSTIIKMGFSYDKVNIVEALRYTYLTDLQENKENHRCGSHYVILCYFSGNDLQSTLLHIKMIKNAILKSNIKIKFMIKLHPFHRSIKNHIEGQNIQVFNGSIEDCIKYTDLAVVSSSTSTALELLYAGKPFCIVRNNNEFNMSPLSDSKIHFINEKNDMDYFISNHANFISTNRSLVNRNDIMYLDSSLPRWKKLINAS